MHWPGRIWNAALKAAPLRLWALFAAGPVITAGTAALVLMIWDDRWPERLRDRQLDFLGWAMLGSLAIVAVIIITLAAVRAKATGPAGTSIEIDADDGPPTTITVESSE